MNADVEHIAFPLVFEEQALFGDTYGGVEGVMLCEASLLGPGASSSDTVLVFMQPVGGGTYLPMVQQLARDGHHVL